MRRKLLVLNLVLLAIAAAIGWQLRMQWMAAEARRESIRHQQIKPLPTPPFTPLPEPESVTPAGYADIAQQMLFSKDRNPTVVIETTPPPPPKPMPALPVLYGVMNLGDGPTAILSAKDGSPHVGIRAGEQIGEFKLVSVDTQKIVFDWEGKLVERKVDDVVQRISQAPSDGQTGAGAARAAQAAPPPKPQPQARPEPGVDMGNGIKACQPGDTSPPGTVSQGMRKVVTPTPFGDSCRWEPVK